MLHTLRNYEKKLLYSLNLLGAVEAADRDLDWDVDRCQETRETLFWTLDGRVLGSRVFAAAPSLFAALLLHHARPVMHLTS